MHASVLLEQSTSADYSIGADCRRRSTLNAMSPVVDADPPFIYRPLAHEDLRRWRLEGARDSVLTNRWSTYLSKEYLFGSEVSTAPPDSDIISQSIYVLLYT
jgi:hypothetical protein